ncbi:MAG: 23S rRNA (pseudouridine(1915)-N(3))-methyltransferase RlmH [Clostridia bacterium]|nr:23S rRNA (pseudouridine(1915)-N(3))-methyltransferase RlmH [Clostridia bacterium]
MKITVLAVGKLSEAHWRAAAAEYIKRMGGELTVVELPEVSVPRGASAAEIQKAIEKESAAMLARLPRRAYVVGLFVEGKSCSSQALAQKLEQLPLRGFSEAAFLIGGSYGMSAAVKAACHELLSFSPMTFPHQLMRVMLLEQLYRARSIAKGTDYHK